MEDDLPESQNGAFSCRRVYDVDSFIARITSLSAHLGGFRLAYRPPFLRRITQNQRVRIDGLEIHKLKQLRLGQGSAAGGYGYDCHVIFPQLPISSTGETHLTDREQKEWIDQILLPALRSSCPSDIIQHHPRSFADACTKASVRKEAFLDGSGQSMDIRYTVPDSNLAAFSAELNRLANSPELSARWGGITFIVSGHDLKLFWKNNVFTSCRRNFLAHLSQCFRFDEIHFPPEDCWLDFGMEDMPPIGDIGRTLLRKTGCLREWHIQFTCPDRKARFTVYDEYPWATTLDAASASVALTTDNNWYQCGIAYNKAYNLYKDLFATPLKKFNPFDHPHLEALGYSQTVLEEWAAQNSYYSHIPATAHERLIKAYLDTKGRVSTALHASKDTDFGIRQEYRITIALFQKLTMEARSGSPDPGTGGLRARFRSISTAIDNLDDGRQGRDNISAATHRAYWILKTKDVNAFVAAQLNRWLLCLEVLIARGQSAPGGLEPSSREQQLIDGVLVSAMVRLLRLSTGGLNRRGSPAIWKNHWISKSPRRLDNEDEDEEEEGEEKPGLMRWGLGLDDILDESGIAWFCPELMRWNTLTLTRYALKNLAFNTNALQQSYRTTTNIQKRLQNEDHALALFHERLRSPGNIDTESDNPLDNNSNRAESTREHGQHQALFLGAELVIRAYIQQVWETLAARASGRSRPSERQREAAWKDFTAPLNPDEALGLQGLTIAMVEKTLGEKARIVHARLPDNRGRSRFGQSNFPYAHTGLWIDKMSPLFDISDNGPGGDNTISWRNLPYRRLAHRLAGAVVKEYGPQWRPKFNMAIHKMAATYLWTIPQYDATHFSMMYKASGQHAADTKDYIRNMSDINRTNWLVPQVKERYRKMLWQLDGPQAENHAKLLPHMERALQAPKLWLMGLLVDIRDKGIYDGIPRNPGKFGVELRLQRAARFMEQLGEHIQASADNSSSESP